MIIRFSLHVQGSVSNTNEKVQWNRADISGKTAMRIGSYDQVSTMSAVYWKTFVKGKDNSAAQKNMATNSYTCTMHYTDSSKPLSNILSIL